MKKQFTVLLSTTANIEVNVLADSIEEAEEIAIDVASEKEWDIDMELAEIDDIQEKDVTPEDTKTCITCQCYDPEQLLCSHAGVPNDKQPEHTCCLYEPKEGGLA